MLQKKFSVETVKYLVLFLFLIAITIFSIFIAVSLGPVKIGLANTYRIMLGKAVISNLLTGISNAAIAIVWNMRVPRVLLGFFTGTGLAVCGCVMQTTVNNPISEPYILGISAGATFGAVVSIILGFISAVGLGAFLGAIAATVLVLIIASSQRKMTTTSLILSGTVVNALFTAFANFIISIGANSDSIMTVKFWTMGSLAGTSWSSLPLPLFVVSLSYFFFFLQYRVFNAMMMGDEVAITLGISLYFYRYLFMAVIAVITGVLVSVCGIIGFVGLITPHIARALVGANHRRLFPVAALLGALFIIWADVCARILIQNAELPIGIFTALVGAPFFIFIVAKHQRGAGQ